MNYQAINTPLCTKDDIKETAQININYVELLKKDNGEFERFLRGYTNEVDHHEMLTDLYAQNHEFGNSTFFREEKKKVILDYVHRLKKGKIIVSEDNLTVCGNPYVLPLYSVGEDYNTDLTSKQENGSIQCYTTRFNDNEFLAAFRNPHNSLNNICYLYNVHSDIMKKYSPLSNNIIAVNRIHTDIQARANGMDKDNDFTFAINHPTMVGCAKRCYKEYPTIINALKESGTTYQNTKKDYAAMDNKFSKFRMAIGYSSNPVQFAMTYYWAELQKEPPDKARLKELYDNFVISSVLAQVVIDGRKREYEIDGNKEIDRTSRTVCMTTEKPRGSTKTGKIKYNKCGFPESMKYTREIKYTEDRKELPQEEIDVSKEKLKGRINITLSCSMNWLEYWLDEVQNASTTKTTPTSELFIKMRGKVHHRQMTKIKELIIEYDSKVKSFQYKSISEDDYIPELYQYNDYLIESPKKIKVGNIVTINRLIETAFGLETNKNKKYSRNADVRYIRKILNYLYKMNGDKFLVNFE